MTGLNLCTGLAFGHGGVYVLQVPYLLFYPDRDRDDVPDGDPEVLLSGFGMEDAQSLANHLTWGPDGWLYGVTGSTSSNHVRGVEFQQAVWRFHPLSRRFELFCEGGGNLFGLTFDADGNLFFSSNGNDLAYHAVQGAYYRKNFGKHGPLHNPYAYGFFEHLPYDQAVAGPRPGGTVYLGDALPDRFRGALLCCDFLQHSASWWRMARRARRSRRTTAGRLLDSRDTWFCAPDLCQGPDGAVYRLRLPRPAAPPTPTPTRKLGSEQRPRSTASPRRARASVRGLDLGRKTGRELVELLRHPNGWYVEQARAQLAARRDRSTWPALIALARQTDDARLALQGLWGLVRQRGLRRRRWRPNCCGTPASTSGPGRSGSWATAGRFPPRSPAPRRDGGGRPERDRPLPARRLGASPTRRGRAAGHRAPASPRPRPRRSLLAPDALVGRRGQGADRHRAAARGSSEAARPGKIAGHRENALRLVRRYAAEGTARGVRGLRAAAGDRDRRAYQDEALAAPRPRPGRAGRIAGRHGYGRAVRVGRDPGAGNAGSPRAASSRSTRSLADAISAAWLAAPADALRLRLAIRAGVADASVRRAVGGRRLRRPRRRGDVSCSASSPSWDRRGACRSALAILEGDHPIDVQSAALDVLARHGDDKSRVEAPRSLPEGSARSQRAGCATSCSPGRRSPAVFLERVDSKEIDAAEVPIDAVAAGRAPRRSQARRPGAQALGQHPARHRRGEAGRDPPPEQRPPRRPGDRTRGRELFVKHCATCHKLFGEGGEVGPDLTGSGPRRHDRAAREHRRPRRGHPRALPAVRRDRRPAAASPPASSPPRTTPA